MKAIRDVVVIGRGAVGSIFATKLSMLPAIRLRVVVDAARLERYLREPICFNNRTYELPYVLSEMHAEPADLILVATKSTGLAEASEALAPFVGEHTIILSLLNGITSERFLADRYGWEHVLYSLFSGLSTRVGHQIWHSGLGTLVFGEAQNQLLSPRVTAVRAFCDEAEIKYSVPEDMLFALWWKFTVNVGFNQASVLLHATFGDFRQYSSFFAVALSLMEEVVALAEQEGIASPNQLIPTGMEVVRAMPPESKTSMLQDVEAGRATEIDIFAGTVCQMARACGVATPFNAAAWQIISAIDEKHQATRATAQANMTPISASPLQRA